MGERNGRLEPGPASGTCSNQLCGPRSPSEPHFLTYNVEQMHLPKANVIKVLTVTSEVVAWSPQAVKIQTRGWEREKEERERDRRRKRRERLFVLGQKERKIMKCQKEVTSR